MLEIEGNPSEKGREGKGERDGMTNGEEDRGRGEGRTEGGRGR